ncbi:PIN domain-containing protein [Micromonospora purpureochromogenes]|uniref:PIN domain-containing protein n=1 Tax=Micromonospora purpureochromogenes TaxID=47872 RepID=UPI0033F49E17
MTAALVFDTCVLPQKGGLTENPLLSALLRIAKLRDCRVLISDMARVESLGARRRAAAAAVDNLRSAIRSAAKYFDSDQLDYYLPSEVDAVQRWERELEVLESIPLEGEDAIEALRREAERVAPARATSDGSAIGSRDAAIWLSVKRLHLGAEGAATYFVSNNYADFADPKDKRRLRPELRAELGLAAETFFFYGTLSSAVEAMAEPAVCRAIGEEELDKLTAESNLTDLIWEAADREVAVPSERVVLMTGFEILDAQEVRAFNVDGTRLAMWEAEFLFEKVDGVDILDDGVRRAFEGSARLWVYELNGEPSVELDSLKALRPTDRGLGSGNDSGESEVADETL